MLRAYSDPKAMPFFKNMENFKKLSVIAKNIEIIGGLGVMCAFFSKKSALFL